MTQYFVPPPSPLPLNQKPCSGYFWHLPFVNILLTNQSIFIYLFNQGTLHIDFGPLPPPPGFEVLKPSSESSCDLNLSEKAPPVSVFMNQSIFQANCIILVEPLLSPVCLIFKQYSLYSIQLKLSIFPFQLNTKYIGLQ